MTFGLLLPVFGGLFLVLALIAVGVRLFQGATWTPRRGQELPMRVVSRVSLGPKQGLAAVQVGDRVMVVSVGDGGVHQVCELDELPEPAPETASGTPVTGAPFQRLLRLAGGTGLSILLAGILLAGVAAPAMAQAPDAVQGASAAAAAADSADALSALGNALPQMQLQVGQEEGLRLSGTVGTVLVIGLLTLLPTLLLLMTSFTRILVILHFLRQALGTQTAPPAQMIAALALLLTGFVMAPTLGRVNEVALEPWMDGQIDEATMMSSAAGPFRDFMATHVRESDLATFLEMSGGPAPESLDDVPLVTLVSAFAISELRTAFEIGFVLFLPFLIIDLVVAAVLMSLGMFMLPPVMVSLPFKLLLFVLVDGWALVVHNVVASFG